MIRIMPQKNGLIILLAAMLVVAPFFSNAHAVKSLDHYVRKYKKIQATPSQLQKLRRYNHLITYYSSFTFFKPKHKVNPDFIKALILAESNGNPLARSNKNALGLTQIIYTTGKEAAEKLAKRRESYRYINKNRLENLQPADLFDPAVNILLACYLISKYNHQHDGKLDLVLSAWNAGENSIVNSRVPRYPETRNLIGKVNGYFIYFLNRKKSNKRIYASRR